ncbi:putative centrosomal of 76 kDa protein [Toxoplasma gondii p89]|uniref:Putative centrosomal of 76 kDa protein n=1 Tax=Toxoplasma gondii p89 TaxID=943119 RepID=A0A086KE10_TOXGO|nr:putative centrosomal of 76 kDa protein [Toxoplasma gondii p89]
MDAKHRAAIYEFLAKRPDICQSLRLHLQARKSHDGETAPTVDVARTLEVLQDTGVLTDIQQQLATYMQSAEQTVEANAERTGKEVKRREGSGLKWLPQTACRDASASATSESDCGALEAALSSVFTQEVQPRWMPENADPNDPPYLLCRFSDGHDFSEYEDESRHSGSYFVIHMSFGSQRFRSRPVEACCEPQFLETFAARLPTEEGASYRDLLKRQLPLHLVVTKEDVISHSSWTKGGIASNRATTPRESFSGNTMYKSKILSSQKVEWQRVLHCGKIHTSVKLRGVGTREALSVGKLDMEIQLLPRDETKFLGLAEVDSQLRRGEQEKQEALRQAMSIAETWWSCYKKMHPMFGYRLIKIFAKTEFGEHLPVNSFVCPLSPRVECCSSYGLDSPFHCARFVAAMETERRGTANVMLSGECGSDVWCSWPALFARGVGTVEDHAMLLCSLFLGFSVDAWVAIGLLAEDLPYCWVITRDQCGDPKNATFWDACTGQRLASFDPTIGARFASVHCVFNHKAFYACCSIVHAADKLHYHFEGDTSMWWKMPEDVFKSPLLKLYAMVGDSRVPASADPRALFALRGWWGRPTRMAPFCRLWTSERQIEEYVKHKVDNYRRSKRGGFDTQWDDAMSVALSIALANYETERTIGVTFGDRAFRDIIKGLAKNYIFKACPLHFHTGDASVYFGALLSNTIGRHILDLPLGPVKCVYGLRCKILKLPEDQVSVWIVLAVRHDPCY